MSLIPNTPEVPWRPAKWLVTDFVQPNNPAIRKQAAKLRALSNSDDDFIKITASYIQKNFQYPEQNDGDPSAGLKFQRYDNGALCKRYKYTEEMEYAWGFPCETIEIKLGICIDTSLLFTSLLIAGGIDAWCCLGEIVNAKTNEVAGYHAWPTFMYKGQRCADETTIHFDAETITSIASLYFPQSSDWVNSNGIYYREQEKFNSLEDIGTGSLGSEMVKYMGLPPHAIQCFGLHETLERMELKHKAMAKEWRKSETIKHNILKQAYGVGV